MARKNSFDYALRTVRHARGLSQEALGELSSRTYVSALERGLKSPTLQKVDQLAEMLEVHPVTLLVLAYTVSTKPADIGRMLRILENEVNGLRESLEAAGAL